MPLSKRRIKELVNLSMKKHRRRQGRVLVEGVNTISQLISNGIMPLELYHSRELERLENCGSIPAIEISEADMSKICMTETPQSLAALYTIPEFRDNDFKRAFYLDGVSDPGNMGTIYRIASAFGFDRVILAHSCCDPFLPKVIRSSLGSVFWIPGMNGDPQWLSEQHAQVIVLSVKADKTLGDVVLQQDRQVIVVIGSEAHGVSEEIMHLPAEFVRISMQTGMESLNAAVVSGIVAHHIYELNRIIN